jgi:iron complex transport system ATP-binding protein
VRGRAILELRHATVLRGRTRILDDVTLAIHAGEHTAIVGPNGSGKSSLIKLLTREHYALVTEGAPPPVRVFGRSEWDVFELRARMGIVSADLHSRLLRAAGQQGTSVLDVVLSGFFATQGVLYGQIVTAEMRRGSTAALERMGAAHLAERTLDELSTGEERRVLIARALVNRPGVLVLDEPTTGLDLVMRHRFMERVRTIAAEGTTVVLVTHHLDEIIPEISRMILLQNGRVAFSGPREEVLREGPLETVFGAPMTLVNRNGYLHAALA